MQAARAWARTTRAWARTTRAWARTTRAWVRMTRARVRATRARVRATRAWVRATRAWARVTRAWARVTRTRGPFGRNRQIVGYLARNRSFSAARGHERLRGWRSCRAGVQLQAPSSAPGSCPRQARPLVDNPSARGYTPRMGDKEKNLLYFGDNLEVLREHMADDTRAMGIKRETIR